MKKKLLAICLLLSIFVNTKAQVLTLPDNEKIAPGMWICYRAKVDFDKIPTKTEMRIAADSKYWLWINGELQVREGALKRGPNRHDTYCDVLRNVDGWQKGENTIAVLVWYFGRDGFSHRNTKVPGMTFDLTVNEKNIDTEWKIKINPAFYRPTATTPNSRLPESNIGYDATKDFLFYQPKFDDTDWKPAGEVSLVDADWNNLVERPIPMWKDYGLKRYVRTERNENKILAYLPYNAQITPYIKLKAPAGAVLDIRTDNYRGGSENNVYAEYVTREGIQEFECYGWMNGHYVIYTIPEGCEVIELMYRETGYDTDFAGSFWCDDPALTSLWIKSQRTLYITMRDTYMDCPDRERAQWWGDVVNELGEAFYALDEKAHLLTRKGIIELMDWQRADSTIFAPVPAGNWGNELPMQMLASVSYYGFWTYYMGTGDKDIMEYVFPKVKKYIHVWKINDEGLVIPRKGGWTWGDWGSNKDMELLFSQWYIIALQGYSCMARLTGNDDEAVWADKAADRMRKVFHEKYWNGSYYISPKYTGQPDDRAQALAVVSGTLPENLYSVIRPFFKEQYHASPYMEKYVLQALCQMGYYQDAMDRMTYRYRSMIDSPLTTLWEGWGIGNEGFGGGSYNHAWSGGPLTILSQYIAGIQTIEPAFKTFSVRPNIGHLSHVRVSVPLSGGRSIDAELKKDAAQFTLELEVPKSTTAYVYLPDGCSSMTLKGKKLKNGSALKSGKWQIIYSNN